MVSEENGQISLVERARIVRNLNEAQLAAAIRGLLDPERRAPPARRVQPGAPRAERTAPRRPYEPRGDPGLYRIIVHNWPLKLAAVGLATLLYGGLVLSQSTQTFTAASSRSTCATQPPDTFVARRPSPPVTEVRYFAPPDARPDRDDVRGTVDLAGVHAGRRP